MSQPTWGAAWDDLRFPFTRDKQGQADKPDFDFANLGLLFPQNDATEIVYIIGQMPHPWRLASNLGPHLHYVQDEASDPVFKIDYRVYNNGEDPTVAFATLTQDGTVFSYTSGSIMQIATFPDIDMSGLGLSCILEFRIYRDDNVVVGDVLVKEFDVHYQIDTPGSRQEFIK